MYFIEICIYKKKHITYIYIHILLYIIICVCMLSHFSHVWFFVTLWTIAHQAPMSMDSPGKNTEVGYCALLQRIFPTQGLNPLLLSPALAGRFFTTSITWESHNNNINYIYICHFDVFLKLHNIVNIVNQLSFNFKKDKIQTGRVCVCMCVCVPMQAFLCFLALALGMMWEGQSQRKRGSIGDCIRRADNHFLWCSLSEKAVGSSDLEAGGCAFMGQIP